ncbi:DUF1013 domain-containing protein [Sagittula stellata]|uniref:Cytoplasmic protein n=1 Tax=Sagittula stellata (strain ATCC 700073 / DSM 11524 / E-37) TaxID=388399 RepID=A3K5T0_SAGS3|nr:cell cycle transcriptional regulator TrcR [Sagittula stellata]EBA07469.1 hypothetical protein SSE37_21760 [Sagittula stellata E-37]
MSKLLHPKATAVWLVDNTTMTFKQIAEFTGFHELEIQGIADGDVAVGVKGFDPIANNQLEQAEIDKAEKDPLYRPKVKFNPAARDEEKRRGPRYTPLSKRQDRPNAILWLVKFHPELTDGQIAKLVGTTKPTIQSIRERTHWNIQNMQPIDPVALGLCKQTELDAAVAKAAKDLEKVMTDDERRKLVSTEQSLEMDSAEPRLPSNMEGLESFSLSDPRGDDEEEDDKQNYLDADSFFNLPEGKDDEDEEENR